MEGSGLKILAKDGEITNFPEVRWAEPLDIGVARAISGYIEALDNKTKSDFYPWVHSENATFTLELSFKQLIATEDGRILLYADWEYKEDNKEVKVGFFASDTVTWSPSDAQSMVIGVNAALKMLAQEILTTMKK